MLVRCVRNPTRMLKSVRGVRRAMARRRSPAPPVRCSWARPQLRRGCNTVAGVTGEYLSQVVAHMGRPDWNRGIASSPQAASAALGVVRVAGL